MWQQTFIRIDNEDTILVPLLWLHILKVNLLVSVNVLRRFHRNLSNIWWFKKVLECEKLAYLRMMQGNTTGFFLWGAWTAECLISALCWFWLRGLGKSSGDHEYLLTDSWESATYLMIWKGPMVRGECLKWKSSSSEDQDWIIDSVDLEKLSSENKFVVLLVKMTRVC